MREKKKGIMISNFIASIFFILFACFGLAEANEAQAALANHLVINEVSIDSIAGTGGTDDDWVELYNPTASAVALDGWSIQKTSSSGSSLNKQALSGNIPAGGYFLIIRNGASTTLELKNSADFLASDLFSLSSNNIVYLVNDNINIFDSLDENIVDFVGFGTASFFEGSAAAPSILETKSISRVPNGEDTNNNSIDYILQNTPTPTGLSDSGGSDLSGTVLLTLMLDANPVQNISASGADIVFVSNASGQAKVNFGLTSAYGSSTAFAVISENITQTISLSGLQCGTAYFYSVYAENNSATENDISADASFSTLPCGIAIDSLTMTKTAAKANNKYVDGWEWEYNITVWDLSETLLKMKFEKWNGASDLNAAANMQYSVNNGVDWIDITADNAYPSIGADISAIDNNASAGRQVKIIIKMKVPQGIRTGNYTSNYGILTEK